MLHESGSIENLIADTRDVRKLTDSQINLLAIDKIAAEFLVVDDDNLETRHYLIKTTLPTVVIALEQLLKELNTKGIPLNASKHTLDKDDAIQADKPVSKFDSLNWLGQFLFRNNPQFSNANNNNPYKLRVEKISVMLEERIATLKAEREARRIEEEIRKQQEIERMERERMARLQEIKTQYMDFLQLSFKLWINSLWRKSPGELYRSEIIDMFTKVSNSAVIQVDTPLCQKILDLIENITVPGTAFPESNPDNLFFDPNDPLYLLDCADIDRWDGEFYIKIMLRLIINWSVADLTSFLKCLSSTLAYQSTELLTIFKENLFIPKFAGISVVRDWLQQLLPTIQSMELPNSFLKDSIKKACVGYCTGREDPRFTFTKIANCEDEVIENDNPAVGFSETSYVRFMKCILGEFGLSNYLLVMKHIETELAMFINTTKPTTAKAVESFEPLETIVKTISENVHFKILSILKKFPEKNGFLVMSYLLQLLDMGSQRTTSSSNIGKLLNQFKTYIVVKEKLHVDQCWNILEQTAENDDDDALLLAETLLEYHLEKQKLAEEQDLLSKELEEKRQSREIAESNAIKKINLLSQDVNLSMLNACNQLREITTNAFEMIYPNRQIISRVAMKETAATKLIEGKEIIKEDEPLGGNTLIESFLRIVSCSEVVRKTLIGKTIPDGKGIDYQMFTLKSVIRVADCAGDPNLKNDIFFTSPLLKENMNSYNYIGIPFANSNTEGFGTLGFLMRLDMFEQEDVYFLERVNNSLVALLERINYRQKITALALSAKQFIDSRLGTSIKLYLNERPFGIYSLNEAKDAPDDSDDQQLYQLGSPVFTKPKTHLVKVDMENPLLESIGAVLGSGEVVENGGSVLVPVIEPELKECVAVIELTKKDSSDLKLKDIQRYAGILGEGCKSMKNQHFGYEPDQSDLDGELIDANSRHNMLFCKVMLLIAREKLGLIDSRAIAELKSYRKPPQSVHRILKGLFYLFGYKPPSVKAYMETVKLLTVEFLKKVISYDPTAIQKKARIKRTKSILKILSWEDTKQKGSKPAETICEWLIISMTLRDIAVAARKSRPDLFERISTASSAADSEVLDDEADEEDEEQNPNLEDTDPIVEDTISSSLDEEEPLKSPPPMDTINSDAEMLNDQGEVINNLQIAGELAHHEPEKTEDDLSNSNTTE
ncbi:hypothetical protein BC833DRAFT_575684 [Globomyces pollinis-pini]|nr:hypothetical protein BC833DRAFT_575684 [Globomyces pollinis-pini]